MQYIVSLKHAIFRKFLCTLLCNASSSEDDGRYIRADSWNLNCIILAVFVFDLCFAHVRIPGQRPLIFTLLCLLPSSLGSARIRIIDFSTPPIQFNSLNPDRRLRSHYQEKCISEEPQAYTNAACARFRCGEIQDYLWTVNEVFHATIAPPRATFYPHTTFIHQIKLSYRHPLLSGV